MIDSHKLQQAQRRVMVLARVNADSYDPGQWWQDDSSRGYHSLLYRFRVAQMGEKLGKDAASGVVLLPEESDLRVFAFYEQVCPSFREVIQRKYLSNGKSVVAFTCATTPTREDSANASKGTVTLYPGSPLLENDLSGFDLLRQLSSDMDELIRFEANDGFHKLVRLFGCYNRQFRSTGGMTNLPSELTDANDMDADLAVVMLDALIAPGAVYRFGDGGKSLQELATQMSLQEEYKNLTRKSKPGMKEPFLSAAILDFRHICTTPGASSLRPLDPDLQRLSGAEGPNTADIVPNLGQFLKEFQSARRALNHASQTLQSNLLLGSIADWILAKNISAVEHPDEFKKVVQDTFLRGVAAGRSLAVGTSVRDEARKRFSAQLEQRFPGTENQAKRQRLLQMYAIAEPFLCAMPVFRAEEVAVNGVTEVALLLDEALTEGDPQVRQGVEEGGRKAGRLLQALLRLKGRIEYRFPGLQLPSMTLCENRPLIAKIENDRIILRGQFSEENVMALLKEAAGKGPDVANLVFRAFNNGENVLPEDQLGQLDETIAPLMDDLVRADQVLVENNRELRSGFAAGANAVAGAALALGGGEASGTAGDIWDRTSKEAARIAASTTGLSHSQGVERPYNRALTGPSRPEQSASAIDRLEQEILLLTQAVLANETDEERQANAAARRVTLGGCRDRVNQLNVKDPRVQRLQEALHAVEHILDGKEPDNARDSLRDTRDWLVALHENAASTSFAAPRQTSKDELTHYFDGRQRVINHYMKKRDDPTHTFPSRTRFAWLSQLVLHIHRRLPMAEGRTDTGNLCGLVLELVKHVHDTSQDDAAGGEMLANQVRDDFFHANPGGLTRFLVGQTLEDVVSLARGYHDQTEDSRRTLLDLRNDLKGIEELLRKLPKGAELVVLNMTADDFTALNWDLRQDFFDAFGLQKDHGPSLLPTALLLSRSAQRWSPASAAQSLTAFLDSLDSKVHGQSHAGRCVVPPVFVAAPTPESPRVATPGELLAIRQHSAVEMQNLASTLQSLQSRLTFPVFAVGAPAKIRQPESFVAWSPYLLLACLCGAPVAEPLAQEGNVTLPTSPLALAFIQNGNQTVASLVNSWLKHDRALGANLFAWLVSVIFRSEMGASLPTSQKDQSGNWIDGYTGRVPDPVKNFWKLFVTAPGLLDAPEVQTLDSFNSGYVNRLNAGTGRSNRFDGWAFIQPDAPAETEWAAVVSYPAVQCDAKTTLLPWLTRLLTKLF